MSSRARLKKRSSHLAIPSAPVEAVAVSYPFFSSSIETVLSVLRSSSTIRMLAFFSILRASYSMT